MFLDGFAIEDGKSIPPEKGSIWRIYPCSFVWIGSHLVILAEGMQRWPKPLLGEV